MAVRRIGPYLKIVDAPAPDNRLNAVRVGVRDDSFRQYLDHHLHTQIGQYYGIVQDGLLNAVHCFRGLNRPLMHGDDMQADEQIIIYSWRPERDFIWAGRFDEGRIVEKIPAPKRVFVVLVREEPQNEFNVFGSVERWNWTAEDPDLTGAPVGWEERYKQTLWRKDL